MTWFKNQAILLKTINSNRIYIKLFKNLYIIV
jgi:hypothetical protein